MFNGTQETAGVEEMVLVNVSSRSRGDFPRSSGTLNVIHRFKEFQGQSTERNTGVRERTRGRETITVGGEGRTGQFV